MIVFIYKWLSKDRFVTDDHVNALWNDKHLTERRLAGRAAGRARDVAAKRRPQPGHDADQRGFSNRAATRDHQACVRNAPLCQLSFTFTFCPDPVLAIDLFSQQNVHLRHNKRTSVVGTHLRPAGR